MRTAGPLSACVRQIAAHHDPDGLWSHGSDRQDGRAIDAAAARLRERAPSPEHAMLPLT